jgi:hypothetical protein
MTRPTPMGVWKDPRPWVLSNCLPFSLLAVLSQPVYSMVTRSPFCGEGPFPSCRMVFWTPMLRAVVVKVRVAWWIRVGLRKLLMEVGDGGSERGYYVRRNLGSSCYGGVALVGLVGCRSLVHNLMHHARATKSGQIRRGRPINPARLYLFGASSGFMAYLRNCVIAHASALEPIRLVAVRTASSQIHTESRASELS